nr:hypothetical protein [Tanacetum cinerariifolium]
MQTQTSNTLHNAILEASSKDRPPMLALGNYVQWKSRIKRYIDTKPNHELIYYCFENPPYELDIRDQLNAKAEAVQIILTGIDNDIYSTVDAYPNACEMWKAIKRLKHDESINVQDLKTNMYWEFGKFTSQQGESLESYYSRFYKMMNELIRNQCKVANHQVNVQFLLQLQPEWQRFVTLVKQSQELKTVSYHKLYDILKQHQHEVNEGGGDDAGGDDVMMMVVDLWCSSGGCDDVEVMVWMCGGSSGSGDADDVWLRSSKLQNDILMFQQHQGESFFEAWTRFKESLQKVTHHAGGQLRKIGTEKARNTIMELAQYEREGWNDPIFPKKGSLNYENANMEQILGIMEGQVDSMMKDAISLIGKSENLCRLSSNKIWHLPLELSHQEAFEGSSNEFHTLPRRKGLAARRVYGSYKERLHATISRSC